MVESKKRKITSDSYTKKDIREDYSKLAEYAPMSLEHYNKEKGTNYEFVEASVLKITFKANVISIGCTFNAKPTDQDGSSTIPFYGELRCDSAAIDPVVTYCDTLKDENHEMVVSEEGSDANATPSSNEHLDYVKNNKASFPPPSPKSNSDCSDDSEFDYDDLKNSYSPSYWYPENKKYDTEDPNEQTRSSVQMSLEYYNEENGADYELVEALSSNGIWKAKGLAIHCLFKAKPTNQDGSSTKLFFGEIQYERNTLNCVVTYCGILDGETHGCKDCNESDMHPPSHFLSPSKEYL